MSEQIAPTDARLTDSEYRQLSELAKREFGLSLSDAKKSLVHSRLSRRLKARKLTSFSDYFRLLEQEGPDGEKQALISALTTNVTSFFRENHHFKTLESDCLENMRDRATKGQRVRLWSAACSSGQEPYSMAMTLLNAWPEAASLDVRILATDIDPQIVQRANRAVYPDSEEEGIPKGFLTKFTKKSANEDEFEIDPHVSRMVTFAQLNLIHDWPFKGPFDVIFCRNVAIYFEKDTQAILWKRFCDMLIPGGHLFIGHSERITGPAADTLRGVGITSYQKPGDVTPPSR